MILSCGQQIRRFLKAIIIKRFVINLVVEVVREFLVRFGDFGAEMLLDRIRLF